jgi:glycosyltransferase involved in cell wall biosynthesis
VSDKPSKALITGGREVGGLTAFAEGLSEGFYDLGIPAEIISPTRIWSRWKELQDPRVLKILSTTAVFAAPFANRAICVTHGFPTIRDLGLKKFVGHIIADWLALLSPGARLTTVSNYAAIHLNAILGMRVDAVIPNPVKKIYLESSPLRSEARNYITFAGRLHPCKNLALILPAITSLLDANPGLRACIVGEGEHREMLERLANHDPRIEFTGTLDAPALCRRLRQTKVFVSGCETEALGITYLEALSQGCNLVMPGCGGGLEIAPGLIGRQIQLAPLPLQAGGFFSALTAAISFESSLVSIESNSPSSVASQYLAVSFDEARTCSLDGSLQCQKSA